MNDNISDFIAVMNSEFMFKHSLAQQIGLWLVIWVPSHMDWTSCRCCWQFSWDICSRFGPKLANHRLSCSLTGWAKLHKNLSGNF